MIHKPVLKKEVLELLQPKPGEFFIDGTLGGGGHAKEILGAIGGGGKLLVIDADQHALAQFEAVLGARSSNVIAVNDNFGNLEKIIKEHKLGKADGLLLDLGLSSDQLESGGRGFTFQKNEPLLMTLNDAMRPLRDLLIEISEEELASIIQEYSSERYARRIAREIKVAVKRSGVATTYDLRHAIMRAVPKDYEHGRIDPATRTFLALRIYANHEFENIAATLSNIIDIVKPGGRVAIITFHGTEDRVVKNLFREIVKRGEAALVNKKVIIADADEIARNPRARSAKLRGIIMGSKKGDIVLDTPYALLCRNSVPLDPFIHNFEINI